MKLTVVQPAYYAGSNPDEKIAAFLTEKMRAAEKDSLTVLPEYSNAGGLSDAASVIKALGRAEQMLLTASACAKSNQAYIAINVLQRREGKIKNSTYLFGKDGKTAFVYDKVHLPPSELALGVERGSGSCVCTLDGMRIAFMTCYDVYYNEQIEYIAAQKPDLILVPGYQRGERTDIIRAQAKLMAFRCNAYVARSSYSMDHEDRGGCSMLVAPDGQILQDLGKSVGQASAEVDVFRKYMRTAGFGGGMVRNDDFINDGCCPEVFR